MDKLLFEVIPPPRSWPQEKVHLWTDELCRMLEYEGIKTITLPEVIDEKRDNERVVAFIDKIDNLDYAEVIKTHSRSLNVMPNKITVRISKQNLLEWVFSAHEKQITHLVLVGGEENETAYPGLSVLHAAKLIKEDFPSISLGGIAIFTRREEAKRIFHKVEQGMDFFISQIVFETANLKCVLLELEKICREASIKMPRIYLSLAAASSKVDIEFMKWLGVEFPAAVWSYFMDHPEDHITERVFEVLESNLDELAHFLTTSHFDIGFNVEQILYKKREDSQRLLKLLKEKVGNCL